MKAHRHPHPCSRVLVAIAPAAFIVAAAASEPDPAAATRGMVRRSDLEIVDCLLPGQVRQLGKTSFLSQRRARKRPGLRLDYGTITAALRRRTS